MNNNKTLQPEIRNVDLIKVKVKHNGHYYIFSRFNVAKILIASGIDRLIAFDIAKRVKKQLIYTKTFVIQHQILQEILENSILKQGVVQKKLQIIRRMSDFLMKRPPIIILIKSNTIMSKKVSSALSDKFGVANVFHTQLVCLIAQTTNMQVNKQLMHKSCQFDIQKAYKDGKPIVIQGNESFPIQLFTEERQDFKEYQDKILNQQSIKKLSDLDSLYKKRQYIKNWQLKGIKQKQQTKQRLVCSFIVWDQSQLWPNLKNLYQHGIVIKTQNSQIVVDFIINIAHQIISQQYT